MRNWQLCPFLFASEAAVTSLEGSTLWVVAAAIKCPVSWGIGGLMGEFSTGMWEPCV